jgi:hypothetical protein
MMKKLFTFCLLLMILTHGFSQIAIEWQNTIGGSGSDALSSIQQTSDGGFILGGYSNSNISGDKTANSQGGTDYWIVKTDALGNIQWQNTIGGSSDDVLRAIQQTADGGYILAGYSFSMGVNYWIVKTDTLGNIQWQNTIGGSGEDFLFSIKQTIDGGYILGGYSDSNISGDKSENSQGSFDYWIVKTDASGNIQWQNTIGGSGVDVLLSIEQTIDGGYILGGYSNSNISGDKTENTQGSTDYWIVKTDNSGNIQWQNTIGGSGDDVLFSIQQTTDEGYILGGRSNSNISGDKTENSQGSYDYWIIKTDASGNIQWQNNIGGSAADELSSIRQTNDGGYILGGTSQSNISGDKAENSKGGYDYWIVKTNVSGVIQWQTTIGGSDADQFRSMCQTTDGGYILGGHSKSNVSGDKTESSNGGDDYWILKLTAANFNSITGKTYLDFNSNSVFDTGEPAINNHTIHESSTGRFSISALEGGYDLAVLDTGNFSVSPSPLQHYTSVPVNHLAYFSAMNQTDSLNDFAFQPNGLINDLQVTINPISAFRPGFDAHYNIHYKNIGTTSLSGTVIFKPDSVLSFVSSQTTPTSITADSIVWNIPTLNPFDEGNILLTVNVSSGAVLGSTINSLTIMEPIAGDTTPGDNIGTWDVIVTGSYDPNDILVSREAVYNYELSSPPYLDYLIRFQNTGTDTAFTVKIKNPLPVNAQLNTIEFLESSHPVQLNYNNSEQLMWFQFDNILLPDSNTNELLSHGYVRYRIKPKSTLIVGDLIENYASIFFDFNAPIITNTAVTEIIPPFTPTITPSNLILCPNESDTLWTQVYDSYQWYKDGNIIPGATQQYLVVDYFNDSGYYFKVEVDSGGFTEISDSVLVDGWAFLPPFVIQSGDFTIGSMGEMIICPGDTAYLILGNPYDTNIAWTDNGVAIPGATNDTLMITQAGLFNVSGSPSQCPNYVQSLFDDVQVVMATAPVPTVTPNNLMLCPNETDTLWTQVFGTYQWFKDGVLIPGATQQFLVVDQFNDAGSMFSVEVTQNSCTAMSQSVLVDGWAFLPPFVIQEGTFTIGSMGEMLMCPGDTAYLILGSPYDTNIQWTDNGVIISGATNDTLMVTQSGLYHVTGSPAQCPNFVQGLFDDITVIVQGPPTPVITLSGSNLTTQSGYTYQWYLNGNPIAGNTNTIPVQGPGSYTVTITDNNGCPETSAAFVITSIIESLQSGSVSVIYNNGLLQINRSITNYDEEIFVLDITGRIVANTKLAKGISQTEIQLNGVAPGIYFVKINDASSSVKFFVE